jgi:Rieske Fe-S protein
MLLGAPTPPRRRFVKALAALGFFLSLAPFSPIGGFLIPPQPQVSRVQRILAPNGLPVNYKVRSERYAYLQENSAINFVYPRTGNPTLDRDPFRQCTLIRLPRYITMPPDFQLHPEHKAALRLEDVPDKTILLSDQLLRPGEYRVLAERNGAPERIELSGKVFEGPQFQVLRPGWMVFEVPEERRIVAFSRVCVHLLCLWSYSERTRYIFCPCHGSTYLAMDGAAVAGPAYLQPPPNNVLPEVKLELQDDGTINAVDIEGVVGTGRRLRVSQMKGFRVV